MFFDLAVCHCRVRDEPALSEACGLSVAGVEDVSAYFCRIVFGTFFVEFVKIDRRYVDVDVDAVEERSADLCHVFFDLPRCAFAFLCVCSKVAAPAWIHGAYQHELCGECCGSFCS